MSTFHRILFPVDFSKQCHAVAPAVAAMANRFHAELLVLHVIDLPPAWFGAPEPATWAALINTDRVREEGRVALDRFVAQEFPGVPLMSMLAEGDAAAHIAEHAERERVDLIMLPTHGYGPFRALLLGSVTAKVLHDAHCPVWTGVHAEQLMAHPPDRWKRMLCAVDGGEKDLGLLRWAAGFAAEQSAELRLVHAVRGADANLTEDSDPAMHEFLFNVAREHVAKLQALAGTHFEVCFLAGGVGQAVRKAAIGHDADLILIGRGTLHKPLGRLRSSAYAIIRQAPCPVISV